MQTLLGLSLVSSFHFLHPAWLLALPVLLALAGWFAWKDRQDASWSQLVDADLLQHLRVAGAQRGRSPWIWVGLAWMLAVVALASPSWQRQQVSTFHTHGAWVIVLDLSRSMNATDMAPDRVTRARYTITDLLQAAHGRRVGLVVFAGEAHTVTPLTTDIATVSSLLQPLEPALMPEAGDNLAPALEEAGKLLHADHDEHGQVLVVSDGVSDPSRALAAANQLRQAGITVQVVGVGTTAGAPEPDGQGGFAADEQGHPRLTRLQTDQLRRVAAAGGGKFVLASAAPSLIEAMKSDEYHSLDSAGASNVRVATWRNGGIWLLPPLLLFAAMLARRGWL